MPKKLEWQKQMPHALQPEEEHLFTAWTTDCTYLGYKASPAEDLLACSQSLYTLFSEPIALFRRHVEPGQ
jgi:hypothetical protein